MSDSTHMPPSPRSEGRASLAAGGTLAAIAVAAMCIDLSNNFHYGAQVSAELAAVMVLAAIGVTALPAAAALRGWDWLLRLGTVACVALTVWAAISAYAERQGAEILARQAAQDSYRAAQADAAAARLEIEHARAEAARIIETGAVDDLEAMTAFHREQIRKETEDRGGCGSACREQEDALKAVLARLPAARAKEAALARAAAAQERLNAAKVEGHAGPAEASMLATVLSRQTGHDAEDIARSIALATTGFAIVVTILMACLMHQAIQLIMQGLGMQERPMRGDETAEAVRRDRATAVATMPATAATPVATVSATPVATVATPVAKPKRGSKSYWLARLQEEHPSVAARVEAGEISVYAGCIATGLRKRPATDWTKPERYAKPAIRAVT